MLEMLKVILLGIVEGITEWLPISSTGHLILVDEFIKLQASAAFKEMFNVVIQLGAIMAVVVLYFHKLNPFSPKKTQKQKAWTIQLWMKVIVACIPAGVIGILFDDWMEAHLHKPEIISAMLILYGILFIVVENWNKGKMPKVTKLSQLSYQTALLIGGWQVLSLIPGTSRSGAIDRWCTFARHISICSSRIYIFPCDPGNVRGKFCKDFKIWSFLYCDGSGDAVGWLSGRICGICHRD